MIREGDILVRYGGEEFLCILPGASRQDAYEIGERMRRIVQDGVLDLGSQQIRMTISAGVTSYPESDFKNPEELIKCADEAMYLAKQAGRNRVTAR
ncbi:MAG TPA: hypothetical protein DD727_00345 [Clostridiales bacterium]|nr:hypothetical protein [Clostridiales bacterium]